MFEAFGLKHTFSFRKTAPEFVDVFGLFPCAMTHVVRSRCLVVGKKTCRKMSQASKYKN